MSVPLRTASDTRPTVLQPETNASVGEPYARTAATVRRLAGSSGVVAGGEDTIIAALGVSRGTVYRHFRWLERNGVLLRIPAYGRHAARYIIDLPSYMGLSSHGNDESKIEEYLYEELVQGGSEVRRQVRTEYGIIDLLVGRPPHSIIEVKADSCRRLVIEAIGQLIAYSCAYPGATLYIATPERIDGPMLEALAKARVSQWAT